MDNMTVPAQVIDKDMRNNFIKNARSKPWGWEWKYTMAFKLLRQGRSVKFVKDVLGVTYQWLLTCNLIKYIDIQDKNGFTVYKRLTASDF